MAQVLIIADDLTGALDSACGFAARGLATRIVLDFDDLASALGDETLDVIAVPTGTRENPADHARIALERIAGIIATFQGILFKKIDSRLKGNIAAELAPLLATFPRPVLASPAIPRLGRMVEGGAIVGEGVAEPIPVEPVLGCQAHIPDIGSDEDLMAALPETLTDAFYVGAAGLGEALARRMAGQRLTSCHDIPGPLLLAIGSRDPVTCAQIDRVSLAPVSAPNGQVPLLVAQAASLVQLTPAPNSVDPASAAQEFATGIALGLSQIKARSLFLCGGETASAVLRQLDIRSLDLLGELLTGVPIARCPQSGLTVITKSGGFGAPDLLCDLMNKFAKCAKSDVTSS